MLDSIRAYNPLRDEFVQFLRTCFRYDTALDVDMLIQFLEQLPLLTYPQEKVQSWSPSRYDNFRFIMHELFLYSIAIALKYEKYNFASELLHSSYFPNDPYSRDEGPFPFDGFLYQYVDTITQHYNHELGSNLLSPMADLIITRVPKELSRMDIIQADLLCNYVGLLENRSRAWWPITYIYKDQKQISLFKRMVSLRHFEKVKVLYNVASLDEMKIKLRAMKDSYDSSKLLSFSGARSYVPTLFDFIDPEELGSVR